MKKLLVILGFVSAIIAVVLAVTPLFNLAVLPILVSFLCGLGIVFMARKQRFKTKSIQYIFLLVIIALSLTVYKAIFTKSDLGNMEQQDQREGHNIEDSKETLDDISNEK